MGHAIGIVCRKKRGFSSARRRAFPGAMPKKRTSADTGVDEQRTNECSDSVLKQEDDTKSVKLATLTDITLQHLGLPIELLEYILIKVVTMEVIDAKLVKSVWKKKAHRVIRRLGTVCSHWNKILTTKTFRNKVHRILEGTAQDPIRLEILKKSSLEIFALCVTTMKDEMFVLWSKDCHVSINVYDRNNMEAVKDVIPLPGINPLCLTACSVSNCVYILDSKQGFQVSVLRITKDADHQFNISAMISVMWLPNPTLCVTTNGDLILSKQPLEDSAAISIYNANGSLQHEIRLPPDISSLSHIIPKSNGNLVLVSSQNGQYKTKLTEIDLCGTILRHLLPPVIYSMNVRRADIYERMLLSERRPNRISLLDPEFNLVEFTGPRLGQYHLNFPYILHYNSDRNELISFYHSECRKGFLTKVLIFRFTDE